MTISLPEDLKQFVKKRSLTAHYGTQSDYIRGLIRDDFFETVLALDLATGAIKWGYVRDACICHAWHMHAYGKSMIMQSKTRWESI
jgi:hypothetical protein